MPRTIAHTKDARNNKKKKKDFLQAFGECCSITKACKKSKVPRRTIYEWFAADPDFKAAFDYAADEALGALEDEAVRRGFEGVLKPVYQGGKKVGAIREFSDRMLELMLKARAPEKYRERISTELTGKNGKPLELQQVVIFQLPDNGRNKNDKASEGVPGKGA